VSEQNTGTRLLPFSINGTTFYAVPLSILGRTPSSWSVQVSRPDP